MPLSINVGLSRKASKDYQSTGISINVTAELDQSLLARPDELQRQIADLYSQAQHAMEHKARAIPQQEERPASPPRTPGRYTRPDSSNGNGNGHRRNGSGMTDSQRRAIIAIARRVGVDPALEAREMIGAELDDLSIRQASELIDHLKSLQPAENGDGR